MLIFVGFCLGFDAQGNRIEVTEIDEDSHVLAEQTRTENTRTENTLKSRVVRYEEIITTTIKNTTIRSEDGKPLLSRLGSITGRTRFKQTASK